MITFCDSDAQGDIKTNRKSTSLDWVLEHGDRQMFFGRCNYLSELLRMSKG